MRNARAIMTGSSATAIAVLTSTASAPISSACAAWLGTPIPASTTTGDAWATAPNDYLATRAPTCTVANPRSTYVAMPDGCRLAVDWDGDATLRIDCQVRTLHRTGVEMEALTGATVAALTVYDMCKALSHAIVLGPAKLVGKRGGKRDVGQVR